ncbi:U3 snoRNP protein [Taxawa tesnikishii (nom. ined.)]|nr:U3 snoRNP protein [Dothideales sp. JES 119]
MAAAAADKARFYAEQSVPELQEYERKKIFSREEITSIAKKRSEFEHILNSRGGSRPADYARYATYEMNLDALRKKRCRRLGVKATTYTGQKKIFFVLERGVRKFQGDMALWMQYLEFCRQEDANKKLAKALTQCLRLHPLKWEIWVWAARHYVEAQADMNTARSYMQRGLRFCKNERRLWLDYAKLEMIYVAKISGRRKILGLDAPRKEKQGEADTGMDGDVIALPDVTAEDINPELKKDTEAVDEKALQKLAASPALSGAIPMTVFDAAMKQFNNDAVLAEQFFDLFAEFHSVPCTSRLLHHVVSRLTATAQEQSKDRVYLYSCTAKQLVLGIEATATATSLQFKAEVAERAVLQLLPYMKEEDELDEAVVKVLNASIKQFLRAVIESPTKAGTKDKIASMVQKLLKERRVPEAKLLLTKSLALEGDNRVLLELQATLG